MAYVCRVALEAGHGRGGKYDYVFDTSLFFDQSKTEVIGASHRVDSEGMLRYAAYCTRPSRRARPA